MTKKYVRIGSAIAELNEHSIIKDETIIYHDSINKAKRASFKLQINKQGFIGCHGVLSVTT